MARMELTWLQCGTADCERNAESEVIKLHTSVLLERGFRRKCQLPDRTKVTLIRPEKLSYSLKTSKQLLHNVSTRSVAVQFNVDTNFQQKKE